MAGATAGSGGARGPACCSARLVAEQRAALAHQRRPQARAAWAFVSAAALCIFLEA